MWCGGSRCSVAFDLCRSRKSRTEADGPMLDTLDAAERPVWNPWDGTSDLGFRTVSQSAYEYSHPARSCQDSLSILSISAKKVPPLLPSSTLILAQLDEICPFVRCRRRRSIATIDKSQWHSGWSVLRVVKRRSIQRISKRWTRSVRRYD